MSNYKFLNLNPKGLRENDCVCRAITFATGLPYSVVYKKLWLTADLYDCERLCKYCYSNYLRNVLGTKKLIAIGLPLASSQINTLMAHT